MFRIHGLGFESAEFENAGHFNNGLQLIIYVELVYTQRCKVQFLS
jgi:hypothetical protein